ncbi:PAS domain-containing sensor histidine kinase [Botrimarina hoheduenensis]|uniref:PAS domain-containing sensor histidine kinase n=1 Tax=Botrimarina hoheduenensis TaxID=2528000 RepID=UPI0018D395E7|nr:ATP-binding protein [Botrimarina hoheduenensis]
MSEILIGALPNFSTNLSILFAAEPLQCRVKIARLGADASARALVLVEDHTEQRRREQRLQDAKLKAETLASALEGSQKAIELAVNGGNLGLWHWDIKTGYFELSHDWLVNLGHTDTDLGAAVDSFRELLHPDDLVLWTEDDAASLALGEPYDRQFRLRRANGTYSWAHALGRANARRDDGVPESLSGIFLDIDANKTAVLKDVGMAKIIEESFNEVYVFDSDNWRFLDVNRGARENLGWALEELAEMTPADILPDYTLEQLRELVRPLEQGEKPRVEFETYHQRRDGSTYPVMIHLQRSELVGRAVYVAIGMDLTNRRELESQLAQAQKLESIGQLAAGVAHEMNTPLQYVSNNLHFLSDVMDQLLQVIDCYEDNLNCDVSPLTWKERIDNVRATRLASRFDRVRKELPTALADSLEGVQRVLHIVRSMKEFSHPGDRLKTSTDLNNSLTSMATITRNRWKFVADLDLQLDPNLPLIDCYQGEMNQVFVNLIINASDAIAALNPAPDEANRGKIVVCTRRQGSEAIIEVQDTGCGMSEAVRSKVFDPFFTTKEVGRGTGQGLSLSHTIVVGHHGGRIEVSSRLGVGTTFTVRLPIANTNNPRQESPCPADRLELLPVAAG